MTPTDDQPLIVYMPDLFGEERWLFGEQHNCRDVPRCVYPCRACAQAKVEHDSGDEQQGSWPEAHGRWLVGGGRNSPGIMGPREWGDWDNPLVQVMEAIGTDAKGATDLAVAQIVREGQRTIGK